MQTQAAAAKKLGHIRRPSYGKVTPISSLLLNLSGSSSIRHDGVSPDSFEPSHVFSFGPSGPILQHHQHQIENDHANVNISFIEQEKLTEENDKSKPEPESKPIEAATFLKCANHVSTDEVTNVDSTVARDADDIDKYLPNGRDKPCLICNVKSNQKVTDELANGVNRPLKELCETLCNDKCKLSTPGVPTLTPVAYTNDTSAKTLARSNSSRQEFLASMLQVATTFVESPKTVTVDVNDEADDGDTAAVVVDNLKKSSQMYFRDKLDVAEALAKTSMMTSPAAKRRLAARKMEMNLNSVNFVYDSENSDYIPPKELLMYLVR